jgi:hypothetical protein
MEYMQVKVQGDEKKITFSKKNLVGTTNASIYGGDLFFLGKDGCGILSEQQRDCGSIDG